MEHGDQTPSQWPGRLLALRVVVAASVAIILVGCGSVGSSTTGASSSPAGTTPGATAASSTTLPKLGGHLMFSRFDESTHTFVSTHIAAADGSGEIDLEVPDEGGGRWSHKGDEIAVSAILDDQRIGTAIITPDGTVERLLTIADKTLNLPCIYWSPDDSRLACEGWEDGDTSRTGIYTVKAADGSDLVRLTTAPDGMVDIPGDFTPDGTKLLFKRSPDEEPGQFFLTNTKAAGKPQPLGKDLFTDPGRFSPDGTLVATSDAGGQLVILNADGTAHNTIAEDGHFLFGPCWSPTGEWLAYSRTVPGEYHADIYLVHPDGSARRQITDTPDNEIVVEWGKA